MTDSEPKTPGRKIFRWWTHRIGDRQSAAARSLAARLRRASPVEALLEPGVYALSNVLDLRDADRLHRLVKVLARVRNHDGRTLARHLGGDPPAMSHLRFERLVRSRGDELTLGLCRAVTMANDTCNVARLGEDLMFWNDTTRTRWIFDYLDTAAPESLEETHQ